MAERKMKDSGIEWVADVPNQWTVMPNKYIMSKKKEICSKYDGSDILSLTMRGVIVRDLDAGGKMPTSFDGYQKISRGNLLMCLFDYDVTPRCIGLIENNGLTSPAYSQFEIRSGFSAKYYNYYYLMVDNTKELLHLAKNLRYSFSEDEFGKIKAPVPPVKEQYRIANYLDDKCSKIDALTADIQSEIGTLEKYKKSIITEVVTKGVDKNVKMKDSGIEWIGEISCNNLICRVKDVLILITDGAHITPDTSKEERDFVSVTDLNDFGDINFEQCLKITKEQFEYFVRTGCKPKKWDVLISKDGTVGKTSIIETDFDFVIASSLVIMRPNTQKIIPKYLEYCLNTSFVKQQLEALLSGSALKRVSVAKNGNLKIVYTTDLESQALIVKYLDKKCVEINRSISDKKKQIETLEAYKKSIIYEYVTGKKEVPTDE